MLSVYDIKPAFQSLLRPIVRGLARIGVRPNAVTIAAVLLSGVVGAIVCEFAGGRGEQWPLILVPAALLARMALNAIDGMLAREHNMQTRLGAILNELGDVIADALLYLPFARLSGIWPALVTAVVLLGICTEFAGVLAQTLGGKRRNDGPLGKSDRALAFSLLAIAMLIPAAHYQLWINYALALLALLAILTILFRVRSTLRQQEAQ